MTIGDGFPNNKTSAGIAVGVLRTGIHDPTVVATEDNPGGLYLREDPLSPSLYMKLDFGQTTNWIMFTTGSACDCCTLTNQTQVLTSAGGGAPPGSPAMGTARTYGILAASAITNTGATVVTGNIGIYPNNASSVTGFPPGTYTGVLDAANGAALAAKNAAQTSYTDLFGRSATSISSTLDGQTLSAGVYTEASGTFNLAASGNGTLTFNGSATDIFVMRCTSTLTTGAGGIPTILLTGGALAANVYWVCGSSATINAGSAGTFNGNIIAQASVTDTLGGTVNGSLIALTGAVTISAATNINVQGFGPNPPGSGIILSNKCLNFLTSEGAVTSDNITAIVAGTSVGQTLMLTNIGTGAITIKNGALTENPNAIDYVLSPKGVISYVWTGTNWRATSASAN